MPESKFGRMILFLEVVVGQRKDPLELILGEKQGEDCPLWDAVVDLVPESRDDAKVVSRSSKSPEQIWVGLSRCND